MRHKVTYRKLGRTTSHRRSLLRSLATSLILHGRVTTTEPKAKEVQRIVAKVMNLAKRDNLSSNYYLRSFLFSREAFYKLTKELTPKYKERPGGYTRLLPLPPRKGDGAEMALIEWV